MVVNDSGIDPYQLESPILPYTLQETVGTAAVQLLKYACEFVMVISDVGNTGNIWMSGPGNTKGSGVKIPPGGSFGLPTKDANRVWLQADAPGQLAYIVISAYPKLAPNFHRPSSGGVTSLNALTGAVNITAGTDISVTVAGQNIQVGFTGASGGGDAITSPNSTLNVGGTPTATTLDINLAQDNNWTGVPTFINGFSIATDAFPPWNNPIVYNVYNHAMDLGALNILAQQFETNYMFCADGDTTYIDASQFAGEFALLFIGDTGGVANGNQIVINGSTTARLNPYGVMGIVLQNFEGTVNTNLNVLDGGGAGAIFYESITASELNANNGFSGTLAAAISAGKRVMNGIILN